MTRPAWMESSAAAPVSGQREADILVDDVDHPCFQLARGDVLGVGPPKRLSRRDLRGVADCLARPEIAAVAEHGEQVSLDGIGKLGVGARRWTEVASVAGPVVGALEDVEQVALGHAGADLGLELGQSGRLLRRRQLLQVRRPVGIDAELGLGREPGIDLGCERRQLGFQCGGIVLAPLGDAEGGAIGGQPGFALGPRQELGAVVGEGLGANDKQVAGLQRVGQMDEHAHFQRPPVQHARCVPSLGDERLPAEGCEAEVDAAHFVPARGGSRSRRRARSTGYGPGLRTGCP